jgi:hypothetical protein
MAVQLTPSKVKGSKYILAPKRPVQLLELSDHTVLNLTIEESKGQRLVYAILESSINAIEN